MEKIDGGANESEVLTHDELAETPLTTPEEDAKLQASLNDALEQAKISEEAVPEKIAAVSAEIKDFKSPEEIKSEIERLKAEYEEKKKAAMQFTHLTSTDSGMGALGSFGAGVDSAKKLEAKYPGISESLALLKTAEKKNSVGFKIWKKPELSDEEFRAINSYMRTGSLGRFSDERKKAAAREIVNKFLAENKKSESQIKSIPQAIWGERGDRYYQESIANLNKQLTNTQEK